MGHVNVRNSLIEFVLFYVETWMNVEQMVTAVTRMASVQTHMEVTAVNVPVDTVAMVEHAQVHSVKLLIN